MGQFLDKYHLLKLNQDQVNRPITPKETEAVIKGLPNKKTPVHMVLFAEFYQTFEEELLVLSHKIETEGTLPNYEAKVILIPKPHKNSTKKISDQFLS
jgi:hypothetical protein